MNSTATSSSFQDENREYFFHGKFLPERANIHLNLVDRRAKVSNRDVRFSVFSFGSEFNGRIASEAPFKDMFEVQSLTYLLLRSILDRLSYINICGYDIDLVGAVSLKGSTHHIFGVNEAVFFDDAAEQFRSAHEKISFLPELMDLKFHDVRLDHALRCFGHALRDDALTPLFCYIAIEALARRVAELVTGREHIADVRSSEWTTFRGALNLKEETIRNEIKVLADDFRHGNFVDTSWNSRKKVLSLTWEIIRRSMHFIRTKATLPQESFPDT